MSSLILRVSCGTILDTILRVNKALSVILGDIKNPAIELFELNAFNQEICNMNL